MTVRKYLESEHERIDQLLAEIDNALRTHHAGSARQALAQFLGALDRYIRGEEDILFPVFERLAESPPIPTRAMRDEHERLLQLASSVYERIDRGDVAGALATLRSLRSVYLVHNLKEDGVIYPLVALAMPRTQHDAVVRHLQKV